MNEDPMLFAKTGSYPNSGMPSTPQTSKPVSQKAADIQSVAAKAGLVKNEEAGLSITPCKAKILPASDGVVTNPQDFFPIQDSKVNPKNALVKSSFLLPLSLQGRPLNNCYTSIESVSQRVRL